MKINKSDHPYFLDKSFFALENGIFEYRNVEQIKFFKKQDLRIFIQFLENEENKQGILSFISIQYQFN